MGKVAPQRRDERRAVNRKDLALDTMEAKSTDKDNELTGTVIGAAITVHSELGPGVEEAAYEEALSAKLTAIGIEYERQKPLPLAYKKVALDCGFRLDILVGNRLPLELKAVEKIHPIHEAQLLTYMRLGRHSLGLLINFDVPLLKDGIRRKALTKHSDSKPFVEPILANGFDPISAEIVRAALEVHRILGPGLIRSAYEECLCYELGIRNVEFTRNCKAPLFFEGHDLAHSTEIPLVVAERIPVYCLSSSRSTELHNSRLLARLRMTDWPYGFLINFNSPAMRSGIRRITLH